MTERDIRDILSENIRRYRHNRKLSQIAFAEKLDISVTFLNSIENGVKWISPQTLAKFSSALNIEPYELFKPEKALPLDVSTALNKFADETFDAVTQALNTIRGYYLVQDAMPSKD